MTNDDLYRGEILEGLNLTGQEVQHWLLSERQRLNRLYCEGLLQRIDDLLSTAEFCSAAKAANFLLEVDPTDERAHRTIMRSIIQSGEPAKALKQFQLCCDALAAELGLSPTTETKQLAGAACWGQLGEIETAKSYWAQARRASPNGSVTLIDAIGTYQNKTDGDHWVEGLRTAGVQV